MYIKIVMDVSPEYGDTTIFLNKNYTTSLHCSKSILNALFCYTDTLIVLGFLLFYLRTIVQLYIYIKR